MRTGGWAIWRPRAHLDEAGRLFRDLGNLGARARVLYSRASLALDQGDIAAARHDLAQALADLSDQSREREDIWRLVERVGTLACRQGTPQEAARLYATAVAHRDAAILEPAERALRARDLEWLYITLGEADFADAASAGETLSQHEAIALLRWVLREQR